MGFAGKMQVLLQIVERSVAQGDKVLVFSQSLYTLDLIQRAFPLFVYLTLNLLLRSCDVEVQRPF
jgi:hypothetical protein